MNSWDLQYKDWVHIRSYGVRLLILNTKNKQLLSNRIIKTNDYIYSLIYNLYINYLILLNQKYNHEIQLF